MSKAYVKKRDTYEEVRSTASTFLIIGALGIIALLLIALNIIPLSMEMYTKILMMIVMGILFVIFLIIGVIYLRRLVSLKTEIARENDMTQSVSDWFFANFTAQSIDELIQEAPEEEEALYFSRYEIMEKALKAQYPQFNEDYLEHLAEEFYGRLYP